MTSERRLLNRKRRVIKHHIPLEVSIDFPGWTDWDGVNLPRDSAVASRRQGPPSEIDAVARLITYLRFHYCKQCISLYVRSLLPFVLSCLPTYLPDTRLSRPVVHLAVIYSTRVIPLRAKLFVPLKATPSPRRILKRLDAGIYPSPTISVRAN